MLRNLPKLFQRLWLRVIPCAVTIAVLRRDCPSNTPLQLRADPMKHWGACESGNHVGAISL
eukprot:3504434-Amphidinium_carterae.1